MTADTAAPRIDRSPADGPVLYRRGSVYTTVDPGASALIAEGSQVVWVGSEQAADSLQDDRMRVVELDGRLITPAFVDSSVDLRRAGSPARAASLGLGALVHTAAAAAEDEGLQEWIEAARSGTGPRILLWPTLASPAADDGSAGDADVETAVAELRAACEDVPLVGLRRQIGEGRSAEAAGFAASAGRAGLHPALAVSDRAGLAAALEGLESIAAAEGERAVHALGVRIDLIGAVDLAGANLERIAACAATVCLDPSSQAPVAELYRQGIPVVWGTGGAALDGWEAVRSLMRHPDPQQRISARAAFVAATRGAWRALGGGHPLAGQLASGTPATYAVWEVEALMVQQAEGTGASWSTDPRARTPLLPALEDEAAPRCTQTVVDGRSLPTA